MRAGSYMRVDWRGNCLWKGFVFRRNCYLGWRGQMRRSGRGCFLSLRWENLSPRKSGGGRNEVCGVLGRGGGVEVLEFVVDCTSNVLL